MIECSKCFNPFIKSSLSSHIEVCTGVKELKVTKVLHSTTTATTQPPIPTVPKVEKKRKLTDSSSKPKEKEAKKIKVPVILNLDTQCGVKTDNGPCTRSITCKMHSVSSKRIVLGRSAQFDQLLSEYVAKNSQAKKSILWLMLDSTNVPTPVIEPEVLFTPEEDIFSLVEIIQQHKPVPQVPIKPFSLKVSALHRDMLLLMDIFNNK